MGFPITENKKIYIKSKYQISVYGSLLKRVKKLSSTSILKRVMMKTILAMVSHEDSQSNQNFIVWTGIVSDWINLCSSIQQSKVVEDIIRDMKLIMADQNFSQKTGQKIRTQLVKLIFIRFFSTQLEPLNPQQIIFR